MLTELQRERKRSQHARQSDTASSHLGSRDARRTGGELCIVANRGRIRAAEGIGGRVKFLPLAWAGMPKTSFRKNSDSLHFGYKFHAVCTPQGIVKTFDISKASTHDIHYLGDLKTQLHHCVLVGDKGYLSRQYQHDLFDTAAIRLETPKRRNQLDFAPFNPVLRKARKRIETLFSQLCDQFMIRRNYAKSFQGLAARILSELTALTLIQWLNQRNGNKLNNLKIVIA